MLANIREVLIITTPQDQQAFMTLLGNGQHWGMDISYAVQPKPEGLAQAFSIGEEFIDNSPVSLILGDNIFYGHGMVQRLKNATEQESGATVFGYYVKDPERYGVILFDDKGHAIDLEEKSEKPKSSAAGQGRIF